LLRSADSRAGHVADGGFHGALERGAVIQLDVLRAGIERGLAEEVSQHLNVGRILGREILPDLLAVGREQIGLGGDRLVLPAGDELVVRLAAVAVWWKFTRAVKACWRIAGVVRSCCVVSALEE